MRTIYLDNAATSWPKPAEVLDAMSGFLRSVGANPGRAGHRSANDAGRIVNDAREVVAEFFGGTDPLRVLFTHNVTESLNLALQGLLREGDHVVTSSMEHNAVMRPLNYLQTRGVSVTRVECRSDGACDAAAVEDAIEESTRLLVFTHASNVVGTILPISEIGEIARRHDCLFLVDAAGTAGVLPMDMQEQKIDLLAFTGHKGLLGPTGTGGLILGDRVDVRDMRPLIFGGTGSLSAQEKQPEFVPDRFEAGTPNVVGIAGLLAGINWIQDRGLDALSQERGRIMRQLIEGLKAIPGVDVYGTGSETKQIGIVSFNVSGLSTSDVGFRLDDEYHILCRVGLHCAPSAHRTIGTFPDGTIRFAPGVFTSAEDIDSALRAIRRLADG